MGLFTQPDAELRELLAAIQASTHIRDIEAVMAGESSGQNRFGESLDERLDRASGLVQKLLRKGKEHVARRLLAELRATPVPQVMLFRAEAPGQFDDAAAAAAMALEDSPSDPQQTQKDRHWRMVVSEVARRGGLELGDE